MTRKPVWRAVARRLGEWHAVLPISTQNVQPTASCKNGARLTTGFSGCTSPQNRTELDLISQVAPDIPAPNLWTVMQIWVHALPETSPSQFKRKSQLQEEFQLLVKELSGVPTLGSNGVRFP